MSSAVHNPDVIAAVASSDEELCRECLRGNEAAWSALIDKYKNLIFSIPIKYALSRDDAAEIFQAVCFELVAELPRLRKAGALPQWLIRVTAHKCLKARAQGRRFVAEEPEDAVAVNPAQFEVPEELLHRVQQEQKLREAIAALQPRCQSLVSMLFYEDPPRAYEEVARELGLAKGSIGFIRMRCLGYLRRLLEKMGFR
jgi:RNA polymerase sigma factor (sigma-70 family)